MILNQAEIALCYQVALLRRVMNRGHGVNDATIARNGMDAEIKGVAGELAFAKAVNVFPRFLDLPQAGGWDCRYKGHRVDVKATWRAENGIFVHRENADIDVYVLAVVDLPGADIVGWAWRDTVCNAAHRTDAGGFLYTGALETRPLPEARKLRAVA